MSTSTTSTQPSYDKNEARGKSHSKSQRSHRRPRYPIPEFKELTLKGTTIQRLRYFSTMDNEPFDAILNKLCDVAEGRRRRSVFDSSQWLRESSNEYRDLLAAR